jgi:hypothetical protein
MLICLFRPFPVKKLVQNYREELAVLIGFELNGMLLYEDS